MPTGAFCQRVRRWVRCAKLLGVSVQINIAEQQVNVAGYLSLIGECEHGDRDNSEEQGRS